VGVGRGFRALRGHAPESGEEEGTVVRRLPEERVQPDREQPPYGAGEAPATGGITVRGVARRYGEIVALDGVDLAVAEGRRLGVVGPSGCGKSTLLGLVAGLDEPDAGAIEVLGESAPDARLSCCALMPQKDLLLPWRSVLDNAAIALENRGMPRAEARRLTQPLLERFGLGGFERRRPVELSGGMRQRVAFVRTLVAGKRVLLLDEPFGALDSMTRGDLQDWLRVALGQEPRTVLLVTHDVEEALLLCDEVAVMSARPGRIVARVPVELPPVASRREAVTHPDFVAAREHVMAELERQR
jgi:ABC-type nitrate/sulfonate/bicarbonate transport system ATPase subunit